MNDIELFDMYDDKDFEENLEYWINSEDYDWSDFCTLPNMHKSVPSIEELEYYLNKEELKQVLLIREM